MELVKGGFFGRIDRLTARKIMAGLVLVRSEVMVPHPWLQNVDKSADTVIQPLTAARSDLFFKGVVEV